MKDEYDLSKMKSSRKNPYAATQTSDETVLEIIRLKVKKSTSDLKNKWNLQAEASVSESIIPDKR